ncbi:MAG: SulP family inorganic anion transporter [Flammeovirgaceae bacterium]|nr:SulP family inorganic anion transporter [Flammeovirgaceae bacterium]
MKQNNFNELKDSLKADVPASIVVFFVALPLCLGIALASGAPLLSGLIAGVIGGVVVGILSGSNLGVSGPAAGLAAIVAAAITELGSFEVFLVAVVLAGLIQILFGILRFGIIGYFFPNSVILGMLSGIGIIIILKQIPHLFGYDSEPMGADEFVETSGENTFSAISHILGNIGPGSIIIGILGLALILFWDTILAKKSKIFTVIQGPIIAVLVGTIIKLIFDNSDIAVRDIHLVSIPVVSSLSDLKGFLTFPDFSAIRNPRVLTIAFTLALIASLETLLSVEATDKLDPAKNVTPTNRELFAQGMGNILSGLIGGLPLTQVIVRSSANLQSNAKSKLSAIIHGLLLLLAVLALPKILNHIPLSVLAAVLIVVGYKLAKPSLFKKMWAKGWTQFVPFVATIAVIVAKDLLWGILAGLFIGVVVIMVKSYQNSLFLNVDKANDKLVKMTFAEEVTFLNKGAIAKQLKSLPKDITLELDVRNSKYIDSDVIDILDDFVVQSKNKNITVHLLSERGNETNPQSYLEFFKRKKIMSYSFFDQGDTVFKN